MNSMDEAKRDLKQAEEQAELLDLLEKLYRNREFKKVILEGFMLKEVARNMTNFANNTGLRQDARDSALGMATAAGYLKQWLSAREQEGRIARERIPEIKEHIELLRAEGLDETPDSDEGAEA